MPFGAHSHLFNQRVMMSDLVRHASAARYPAPLLLRCRYPG